MVCELCRGRAERDGWIREAAHGDLAARGVHAVGRGALRGRLRARRERAALLQREVSDEQAIEESELTDTPLLVQRDLSAVPTNAEVKLERALELFNKSDHPRTVAGVARSLGTPVVAVRPADDGSVVAITVAWELSWYRYEVDLAEADGAIRVAAQGTELSELGPDEQEGNATVSELGELIGAAG